MMDGFSDWTSDTVSFGYGPMAQILSNEFFEATCNYYQQRLKEFTEPVELNSDNFSMDDDEWDKCWFKIIHAAEDTEVLDELNEEESHLQGLKSVISFTAKWGFRKEEVKLT